MIAPYMESSESARRSFSSFDTWTGARSLATIGTNAGSEALPFQGWRNFKEAFAPELIARAVHETGNVNSIVDPFGGSGTTALAAQFLGARPTTIEVNPFLADLIEAKITKYDWEALIAGYARVRQIACGRNRSVGEQSLPSTFIEPGVKGRFLFSRDVAERFFSYRAAIDAVADPTVRRLFRVLLVGLSVSVSNAVVSGKGRRYKRNWQDRQTTPGHVDRFFEKLVLDAMKDLRRFASRRVLDYALLRGDARLLTSALGMQDLAVFSPPYPNSFDYTDVYNIELWMGGYLGSAEANRALRESTLRSHVQIRRDLSYTCKNSPSLTATVDKLITKRSLLWNKDLPMMVGAYCEDLTLVLSNLRRSLREHGRVYMVVGDSRYAGVNVPVAAILNEIAPTLSFNVLSSEPFRSMRVSPQQGGQTGLPESLIVLEAHR